ncbi:unnamed protein product [Prunus armeniaca]|uniref:Expansin n=1 Tax=Prunus armeniaca TaxID=36596 RepID=A0A6J5U1G5_PRUAR|nr:unnamed protein product [Prunus armeniaca]
MAKFQKLVYMGSVRDHSFGSSHGQENHHWCKRRRHDWDNAHATGACGYGNLFQQGYGLETNSSEHSTIQQWAYCGACFEVMCVDDPQWCIPNSGTIKITAATNFCPTKLDPAPDHWCTPPMKHFDLSMGYVHKACTGQSCIFLSNIEESLALKKEGLSFCSKENPFLAAVLVYNVGRVGI